MDFLDSALEFLGNIDWLRVFITVIATVIAVVLGIYYPAKVLEAHTNQPIVRYVWYVIGTCTLVMVYLAMYGYGHFWTLYHDSEMRERHTPAERRER